MTASILRNPNSVGGLFDQPAAHTLALSTHPQANSVPSAFQMWDQPAIPKPHSKQLPLHVDDNNQTLSYIDKPGNPTNEPALCNSPLWNRPPHFDLCAFCVNAPPPHPNVPVPLRQAIGPGALQPPFPTNPPCSPLILMPNPPTNTNYFGPPTPGGPLLFNGPWGLHQAMWANPPAEDHPTVDPLEDGAQL
ncbi:hypothetical protein J132_00688 [Termitomyces sp. J132]|nr:hypothetical protein J132_00688 [Termitomyces sp. J132]